MKISSYIAQYPILRIAQSALYFISLVGMFNQTPSQLLWEASSQMLQLMREGCSYTYPPLSIARYSFIQLSELEQCRVKKLAQGFNTIAQDSNPGLLSRESKGQCHHSVAYKTKTSSRWEPRLLASSTTSDGEISCPSR